MGYKEIRLNMIIIYNLVLYHTFGNRKAIYMCYVASDFWGLYN